MRAVVSAVFGRCVRRALRSASRRIKMSAFTPTRKSVFWTLVQVWLMEKAGSHTGSPGCSIKLPPCPGRESHRGIVLDPAQSELADAPVQREASELRLGRVRRKDFHLPSAQVLDQPAQLEPDFDVLCRG